MRRTSGHVTSAVRLALDQRPENVSHVSPMPTGMRGMCVPANRTGQATTVARIPEHVTFAVMADAGVHRQHNAHAALPTPTETRLAIVLVSKTGAGPPAISTLDSVTPAVVPVTDRPTPTVLAVLLTRRMWEEHVCVRATGMVRCVTTGALGA
ncbi:MAG: hypothetical protein V2I33_20070, partial [Kangiellaceae bacterium]|nr:hypothetical protein [Kangiellaceae bacterium]